MVPLSKNKIKFIRSLDQKKIRKEEGLFLGEGPKLVGDLFGHFHCQIIIATDKWLYENPKITADEVIEVSPKELSMVSLLQHPQQVLAVFRQPHYELKPEVATQSLCLALDNVQDPGNLGTIIRLADWFGIEHLICSMGTADVYNPKTVQATMGALARVKVHYTSLPDFINSIPNTPIYGTFLDGKNMYEETLTNTGLLVMGNEGNGIGSEIEKLVDHKLYIPNYPVGKDTSESLNVAVATAVVCAEFRRQAAWK